MKSSRCSTSSGRWAALCAVLAAGVIAGGCGRRDSGRTPPDLAYVAIERLVPRHPLWEDLQRLDVAASRLERLAGEQGLPAAGEGRIYGLSPLVLPALPAADFSDQQARLQRAGRQYLAELTERLQTQQTGSARRRREELMAVDAARQATRRREAEAAIREHARAIREQNAARIANLTVRINTLQSRIAIVPPPPDREVLEAMVKRLEAERAQVRQEARTAEAQARQEWETRLAEAARADVAQMERQLQEERAEARRETDLLVRTQRAALEQELAALTASPRVEGMTAGPYVIEAPFARTAGAGITLEPAAARVREQREALRRFIVEDTTAAVEDAAQARNIRVVFQKGAENAPDRTAQFGTWIAGRMPGDREDET